MRRFFRLIFKLAFMLMIVAGLALLLPRLVTSLYAATRIHSVETSPARPVAIVFGAGLRRDGTPTAILRDRVETAAALYFEGKVERLLMSGDNRFDYHNEPGAMRDYAIRLGVPETAIVLDYAGRRTYDTCYRAGSIFGVEQAVLVTQAYHLPRALYTCNMLGVEAQGVAAVGRQYLRRSLLWWNLRELPATAVALWDVHVARPLPVLGEPEPIFPLEAQ